LHTQRSWRRERPRTETLKPGPVIGWAGPSVEVQITLIGERQARPGHEFIYRGPQPECGPCKVRGACLNQDLGRRYRITRVRDVADPCFLKEEHGRVVEVDLVETACSQSGLHGVEGSVFVYEKNVRMLL